MSREGVLSGSAEQLISTAHQLFDFGLTHRVRKRQRPTRSPALPFYPSTALREAVTCATAGCSVRVEAKRDGKRDGRRGEQQAQWGDRGTSDDCRR